MHGNSGDVAAHFSFSHTRTHLYPRSHIRTYIDTRLRVYPRHDNSSSILIVSDRVRQSRLVKSIVYSTAPLSFSPPRYLKALLYADNRTCTHVPYCNYTYIAAPRARGYTSTRALLPDRYILYYWEPEKRSYPYIYIYKPRCPSLPRARGTLVELSE